MLAAPAQAAPTLAALALAAVALPAAAQLPAAAGAVDYNHQNLWRGERPFYDGPRFGAASAEEQLQRTLKGEYVDSHVWLFTPDTFLRQFRELRLSGRSDWFVDEIVPIQVPQADGSFLTFAEDEHPRRDTSLETLAGLKVLHPEIEGFTVTAGNSSGTNDAAAVLALAAPDTSENVLASILSWSQVGLPPRRTGSGPIYAIPKALALAGRKLEDVALFEINEAFACVAMFAMHDLGIAHEKINVHGGATALGHPIGASGTRIITTLIGALKHRGLKRGVASLCIGGGEATAVAVELV